jgi:hypothetical protein
MKNLSKKILVELYTVKKLTPYKIGEILGCNHKTIRAYLKNYDIPIRTAPEYNYLPRVSHQNPNGSSLMSHKSIAGHIAFLCEGWHTNKTNVFSFCNQDPNLVNLIIEVLSTIYKVKTIRIVIAGPTKDSCRTFLNLYKDAKVVIDPERKNPIIRVYSGGKTLARDFIKNAYDILSSLS